VTNPRFDYFNGRVVLNQKRNPAGLNPCTLLLRSGFPFFDENTKPSTFLASVEMFSQHGE
jgi:hypothetical protein